MNNWFFPQLRSTSDLPSNPLPSSISSPINIPNSPDSLYSLPIIILPQSSQLKA